MEFGYLDLKAAAARLHMDELELKHFAQREEVPSQKRGDEYFFERSQLDEWAQRRMIGLHPKQLTGEHTQAMDERARSTGEVRVSDLLAIAAIAPALGAKNKGGVLRDMTELADSTGKVYDSMDVQIERTSDQFMNPEVVSGESANFGDSRDMKETLSNGSNRFGVYLSAIPAIRDEPLRLLIGKYNAKLMDGPHRYQIGPFWHMHNYLIQVLMLTGLVGFLLVLCFSVLLVIRMVRLYFSDNPKATADIKVLTLPVSGILLYGMLETVIFTASADERAFTDFRELFFFLIAGAALAWSYELAPRKKQ